MHKKENSNVSNSDKDTKDNVSNNKISYRKKYASKNSNAGCSIGENEAPISTSPGIPGRTRRGEGV